MAISIDWGTKIISVPQADLTFVGGTTYILDTESFRLSLRDLEDSELGIIFPKTHNHSTQVLLGGVSYARIIEIINGYTITFEETGSPYVVSLTGSNNNVIEVTNLGTVQILSNNSAGLINVTELQQDAFNNAVHVDQSGSRSGITYPTGTPAFPVNNIQDAVTIANARGFTTMHLIGNATLDTGDNVDGFDVIGSNALRTALTVNPGASTSGASFSEMYISGTLDGTTIIRTSAIGDLNNFSGFLFQCSLTGNITLGGGGQLDLIQCSSGIAGQGAPHVNCGGSGQSISCRAYSGGIHLHDKTGPEACSFDFISGQLVIDTSATNGTVVVRGNAKVTHHDTGDYMPSGTYNGSLVLDNESVYGTHLQEVNTLLGLNPSDAVTITPTGADSASGDIDINFTGDGVSTTTMTRQP